MTTTPTTGEDRRGLTITSAGVELRADDDTGAQRFTGHAAVFDVRTPIGNPLTWGFYEEIAPGAFSKTLSEGDARMLIDHDSYYVVSRASADTLALEQDDVGLAVDSALDTNLSYVNDLIANLGNRNITGMSFGFYVIKDEWWEEQVELSDGNSAWIEVRRLLELRLVEVSAVTFPAYEETDAGLRMRAEDEVRAVGLAYGRRERADDLLEARSRWCPGLSAFRRDAGTPVPRTQPQQNPAGPTPESTTSTEPGETTRTDENEQDTHDDGTEPGETTPPTDDERAAARMAHLRALIPST